jgi:PBSX family phage terminase large subunit
MIELNPKFKPLYTTSLRYILVTGGRGSAKSFEVATHSCLLTFDEWQKILFTRYTMASAEMSIIPEFEEKLMLMEVSHAFRTSGNFITNKGTQSEIMFSGIKTSSGNQTGKLKSLSGVTTFIVDEAEEFVDEESFDTIDMSVRAMHTKNTVILIMNPSNKDHWIYKRWIKNTHKIIYIDGYAVEISTHPDVLHIHTTYLDNLKHLSPSFIDIMQKLKASNPKMYGHKAIGQWLDMSEGALWSKNFLKTFKHSKAVEEKYESSIAYIDVADEGSDYLCMPIVRNIGNKLHVVDVIYSDKNTDTTLALCAEALIRNDVTYCRVESNSMGGLFGTMLQKLVPDCMILKVASTSNKHTRIIMDAFFISEHFHFKHDTERNEMYEKYLNDMCSYSKNKDDNKKIHDDAPDATSGLAVFARSMLQDYF